MLSQPKAFVLDIETFPLELLAWDLKDQNFAVNQIKKDWELAAFAVKPLNSGEVAYYDRSMLSERQLVKKAWHVLNDADILVTQNGQSFDAKKLTAKFIEFGLKPPSPYRHLDTYKIGRQIAKFTSNKLEYYTSKINKKFKKLLHKAFPGMSLWIECRRGNKKAWASMKEYNIHDVLSTEELYNTFAPWTPLAMPNAHISGCRVCGSYKLERRGFGYSNKVSYQKLQCRDCKAWSQGKKETI